MANILKPVLVGLGLMAGLLLLIVSLTLAAINPQCEAETRVQARAPSGKYVAKVLVINCGATTAYTTGVVVSETTQDGSASTDPNRRIGILSASTLIAATLTWGPQEELLVTYEDRKVYDRRIEPWRDVTFRYATWEQNQQ